MIRLRSGLVSSLPADAAVVVFAFTREKRPSGAFLFGSRLDKAFEAAREDGFTGAAGQVVPVRLDGKPSRFLFVGLGAEADATLESLRRGASAAARRAVGMKISSLAVRPAMIGLSDAAAQAVVEGALLGTYRFTTFQSHPEEKTSLSSLFLIGKDSGEVRHLADGGRRGELFARAVTFARNLINTPPNRMMPADFVKKARESLPAGVKLTVFAKRDIERMGMGALLGVNRGSAQPPYFLHLVYKPATAGSSSRKPRRRIGICGKGITFDSGGLSLKTAAGMETMKYDMAGAASVLSLFTVLPALKPDVEVHGFTPLTENMPGGNAQRPGDVVRTMRGRTIEVLNTDAEGRLVLADALSYASRQNLDEVLDIATLTGACVIALGTGIAGLLGTDPALNQRVKDAARAAGEKVWELPLEPEYEPLLKSHVADIKNIGPVGQAGTILAALFMKTFVDAGLPWCHLDIASTGWAAAQTPLSEVGATGVMIRTLLTYLTSYR